MLWGIHANPRTVRPSCLPTNLRITITASRVQLRGSEVRPRGRSPLAEMHLIVSSPLPGFCDSQGKRAKDYVSSGSCLSHLSARVCDYLIPGRPLIRRIVLLQLNVQHGVSGAVVMSIQCDCLALAIPLDATRPQEVAVQPGACESLSDDGRRKPFSSVVVDDLVDGQGELGLDLDGHPLPAVDTPDLHPRPGSAVDRTVDRQAEVTTEAHHLVRSLAELSGGEGLRERSGHHKEGPSALTERLARRAVYRGSNKELGPLLLRTTTFRCAVRRRPVLTSDGPRHMSGLAALRLWRCHRKRDFNRKRVLHGSDPQKLNSCAP